MTKFQRSYDEIVSSDDGDRWESVRRHRPTYLHTQDAKPFCALCREPLTGVAWAMETCRGFPVGARGAHEKRGAA